MQSFAGVVPPTPGFNAAIGYVHYSGEIGGSREVPLNNLLTLGLDADFDMLSITGLYVWDTGQGRWNLSLYHQVELTNSVLVAPGGPVLDLLDGSALTAGGVARHGLELEGGLFHKGMGLRANGTWSAPVTVRSTGAPGSTDLRFGSLFKLNLRAFVNFDQKPKIIEDVPFLKGVRLSLKVDNLFDSRQRVTDQTGSVPLGYQLDYRDPRGRVIGIDFRKMF